MRAASGPWITLAITLAIQAFVSMASLTVPAMAPAVAAALHVSPTLVGAYVACVYFGAVIASLAAGPMVLRFGAIRVSQVALLLCALGLALMAMLPAVPVAAAAAVLVGLGYGPVTPASSHLLAKTTPAHRASLVFSIKQTGVPVGGVMAGALVPALALAGGAATALLATAAGCLLCAALAQPLRAALDADRQPGRRLNMSSLAGPVRLVASQPELRRLASFSFVFSTVQMCLASFLVTYLHGTLGMSLVAAGAALAVAQAGAVAGRILWGYITDRWLGPRRMLAFLSAMMALSAAGTAALPVGVAWPVLLVLVIAFGASATGWNGVYLAEVARLSPPGMASAATGGALAVTFLGVVLGPVLFAALAGATGSLRVGYAALVLPTLLCCAGLLFSRRPPG